ncbi:MAG: hypothetical protein M0Z50_14235 [Planctomycetia bacterium]|jgi:hypothetical protein|nr:hypothetical protein [Planctomycetia bacterium]
MNTAIIAKNKRLSILIVGLVMCAALSPFAHAQTEFTPSHMQGHVQADHALDSNSSLNAISNHQVELLPVQLQGFSLSNHALASISGKGIPVSLPSVGHQNKAGVVLWDEIQTRRGGGGTTTIQNGMNNFQSMSMAATR